MRRLILLALTQVVLGTAALAQGAVYSDQDWNIALSDNCGLPQAGSVSQITSGGDRKLRVTLNPGDRGKCSTDNRARHRAPYWERAELAQKPGFARGKRHQISVEVRFEQGFTGERETFFQIHGWARGCKNAYPPVMMKFDQGLLRIETLRGVSRLSSGRHRNVLRRNVAIDSLRGKTVRLEIAFDTRQHPARLSLSLGGQALVRNAKVDMARCAEPHIKLGIYRPGGKGSETSVVVFDDVRVE